MGRKIQNSRMKYAMKSFVLKNHALCQLGTVLTAPYRFGERIRQHDFGNRKQIDLIIQKQNELGKHVTDLRETLYAVSKKMDHSYAAVNHRISEVSGSIRSVKDTAVQTAVHTSEKLLKRNTIEHLDYHLTEHCNLNCRGCSTFAPIAEKSFASLEQFQRDIHRLYELVGDCVQQIHLLGGEPLLHPEAEQFARACRLVFQKARIDLTTNGLLVYRMTDQFWEALKENHIAIKYTRYPIEFDYYKMAEYIKNRGVYVFSAGGEEEIKYFRRIPLNAKGSFNMYHSFIQCPYTDCAQLRDGKLYHCPASAYYDLLNRKMEKAAILSGEGQFQGSEYDCLRLDHVRTGSEVFEFLSNAVPFCQYCDMDRMDCRVDWGVSGCDLREWVDLSAKK